MNSIYKFAFAQSVFYSKGAFTSHSWIRFKWYCLVFGFYYEADWKCTHKSLYSLVRNVAVKKTKNVNQQVQRKPKPTNMILYVCSITALVFPTNTNGKCSEQTPLVQVGNNVLIHLFIQDMLPSENAGLVHFLQLGWIMFSLLLDRPRDRFKMVPSLSICVGPFVLVHTRAWLLLHNSLQTTPESD